METFLTSTERYSRRFKILNITPVMFLNFIKPGVHPPYKMVYPIPEDARIVHFYVNEMTDWVKVGIWSSQFDEVLEGALPPYLEREPTGENYPLHQRFLWKCTNCDTTIGTEVMSHTGTPTCPFCSFHSGPPLVPAGVEHVWVKSRSDES